MSEEHSEVETPEQKIADDYGYSEQPIDLDMGVLRRTVPHVDDNGRSNKFAGYVVYMYRDLPGLYLSSKGSVLPMQAGSEAGFNPRKDALKLQEKIARKALQSEYEGKMKDLEQELKQSESERVSKDMSNLKTGPVKVEMPDYRSDFYKNVKVIREDSRGEPAETNDFIVLHVGGPVFSVAMKDDGEEAVILERATKAEAVKLMLDEQKKADLAAS